MKPSRLDTLGRRLISVVLVIAAGALVHRTSDADPAPIRKTDVSRDSEMKDITDLKAVYTKLGPSERILDVRTPEEYSAGHIPGAINIDHRKVGDHAAELSKFNRIYVYCRSGKRSQAAAETLRSRGVKPLTVVTESGMPEWMAAGLPVEKGNR